jgi:hypothetical protein
VILSEGLGPVDLLTLQNGVLLPMADLQLPNDVTITQIRLVLESEGNYIIKGDGSRCDLKTPSEQKTGIKFILNQPVLIESGFSYSIVADFDASKSIVLTGNGGCLLKPVLKLKSANKISLPPPSPEVEPSPSPVPAPEASPTPAPTPTATPVAEPSPTPTPMPSPTPDPSTTGSTQTGGATGWDTTQGAATDPTPVPADQLVNYFNM